MDGWMDGLNSSFTSSEEAPKYPQKKILAFDQGMRERKRETALPKRRKCSASKKKKKKKKILCSSRK